MLVPPATIETFSGRFINILEPDAGTICIEDIAHGLSNQCRYGGQCKYFYSVAEHSWLVSKILDAQFSEETLYQYTDIILAGLLHDASEAYLVDIPTPVKKLLKDYKKIEHVLMDSIFDRFAIPYTLEELPNVIHQADVIALKIETAILMPSQGKGYSAFSNLDFDIDNVDIHMLPTLGMYDTTVAKQMFLNRYHELLARSYYLSMGGR